MARPNLQAPGLGLAYQLVRRSRIASFLPPTRIKGTFFQIPLNVCKLPHHWNRQYGKFRWYRHVCAIGAIFNILMMTIANLVGFVVGTDGVKFFFARLIGTWEGVRFTVLCCCCIFVGVQLMFEYRQDIYFCPLQITDERRFCSGRKSWDKE